MDEGQFNRFLAAQSRAGIKINTFSSGDAVEWLTWRQHVEAVAHRKGWTEAGVADDTLRDARWAIRQALSGAAAQAVADVDPAVVPAAANTVAAYLDILGGRFCPEAEGRLARASFKDAGQTDHETVLQWHTRCRGLFMRAYPNVAPETAPLCIERYIEGLRDHVVRVYVYDANPRTYAEAVTLANNKTASGIVNGPAAGRGRTGMKIKQEPGLFGMEGGAGSGCHFCGENGHFKRECRLWAKAQQMMGSHPGQGRGGGGRGGRRGGSRRGRGWAGGQKGGNPSIHAMGEGEAAPAQQPENC